MTRFSKIFRMKELDPRLAEKALSKKAAKLFLPAFSLWTETLANGSR